jgi:hypothetical protein
VCFYFVSFFLLHLLQRLNWVDIIAITVISHSFKEPWHYRGHLLFFVQTALIVVMRCDHLQKCLHLILSSSNIAVFLIFLWHDRIYFPNSLQTFLKSSDSSFRCCFLTEYVLTKWTENISCNYISSVSVFGSLVPPFQNLSPLAMAILLEYSEMWKYVEPYTCWFYWCYSTV